MRRKTIFLKMVISALLLSALSGCGKKADVDYIQENDSRQDAVSASDLHLNYSVSNGRTTVNVDADVNTTLSTQSAPVATIQMKISHALQTQSSMKEVINYSCHTAISQRKISLLPVMRLQRLSLPTRINRRFHIICWRNAPMHKVRKPAVSLILSRQMEPFNTIQPSRNFATTVIYVAR